MMSIFAVFFLAFFSLPAQSQSYSFESSQRFKKTMLEVKPLPMVFNLNQGFEGFGLGFERLLNTHWSIFADATYVGLELSDRKRDDLRRERKNDVFIYHSDLTSVVLGSRYYADTQDSSWYTGLALGFNDYRFKAFVDEREVRGSGLAILPRLEAGYRWTFDYGLSLRLGALAQILGFQNYKFATVTTAQQARERTENKVKHATHAGIGIDVGLAYQF